MSGSKHFEKIAWVATAVMLVITVLFMNGASLGLRAAERTMGYENRLFDNTRVHTMDIVMDDWNSFITNAASEEYSVAALVIDGEAFRNVAIRGKGNTSLSTVSSMGSSRYSFKVEFDHYDFANSYYGLDKLSLNNLIQDTTMMKDYLTYTMMLEFGADSPLCSFVYITVNGEDWGLYLAVEGLEDSFLERNYGSDYGELYKPDSMSFGGGRGNGKDFNMPQFRFDSSSGSQGEAKERPSGGFDPSAMFGSLPDESEAGAVPEDFDLSSLFDGSISQGSITDGDVSDRKRAPDRSDYEMPSAFGGSFGMGSSDVRLQYIDDNPDNYTNIWNNAKTNITDADQKRLIESLKKLSQLQDIEEVVNVEAVIRYFVVHNFVCNGDSYTGTMVHNYYLYEKDGQLTMLPWDYNLAYGTFQSGNATSTVNTPIDATASGGLTDSLPMLNWIFESEEYTALYHQYFSEFLNTVDMQEIINNAYNLIYDYVKKDPTSFYTVEEFETGIETLKAFCSLRCESITIQLANGETKTNMQYVAADNLNLSNMGSMGGMGGGRIRRGSNEQKSENPSESAPVEQEAVLQQKGFMQFGTPPEGEMPDMGNLPEEFSMPENFDKSQMPDIFGNVSSADSTTGTQDDANGMQKSTGDFSSFSEWGTGAVSSVSSNVLLVVSLFVLVAGLAIAIKYKY